MHIVIWLLVGGLTGWLASMLRTRSDNPQAIAINVGVGMAGALLSVWLVAPWLGLPPIEAQVYSPLAFFVSLVGAAVALALVQLLRRTPAP